jgi:long-chain acyl-CoA synthetase
MNSSPLPERYAGGQNDISRPELIISIGIWGLIDVHTPNVFTTVDEIFECGVNRGKDRPFLGHRPIVSTTPLKYANHFVWQSYGDVDTRRRHIGSALTLMFSEGKLGGGDYQTVGIWSMNRPGMLDLQFALMVRWRSEIQI